jgi:hypothetical protein
MPKIVATAPALTADSTTTTRRIINTNSSGHKHAQQSPNLVALHHIIHWYDGGPTDLDNLVLLCKRHHRMQHHGAWKVRLAQDGRPEFIPPRWVDPNAAYLSA